MAYIRKRGKNWQVEIKLILNGKPHHEYGSFATKNEANVWAAERESELLDNAHHDYDRNKTLRQALIRYRDEESPKKKSGDKEILRINSFLRDDSLPLDVKLPNLTPKMFADWRRETLSQSNLSNSTLNRYFSIFRAMFKIAIVEWQWLKTSPIAQISRLPEAPPRNRRISQNETSQILEALDYEEGKYPQLQKQQVAVAFLIALETAMRLGEIINLDWANVNFSQRYCTLVDTKNGDRRDVPLSSTARSLLKTLRPEKSGPVFNTHPTAASALFAKYVREKTDIQNLTFHDTRHEAITRLAQKLDVLNLARMIGHRDPSSLMIYYNPTATELADLLD